MPDYRSLYSSDYLGSWDFEKPATLKIREVKGEELTRPGGKTDKKPVIYFVGTEKGFVCNKTNAKTIVRLHGSKKTEDWVGKEITLYKTQTDVGGEMKDCIRVKPEVPK